MINNKIVYVEKQSPFDVEAKNLFKEFQTQLNITTLTNVRILNKYLIKDIDDKTFARSLKAIFSEPPIDNLFLSKFPKKAGSCVFGVSLLPGQFNQRADSAEQCLKLINPKTNAKVQTTVVYILEGAISKDQIKKVKKYLINIIDSCETEINSHEFVETKIQAPPVLNVDHFREWNKDLLVSFHAKQNLAMSIEDLLLIQTYFKKENRDPTITEIKVIDTYWSDHCRHTTFETKIERIVIPNGLYTNPIKNAYHAYLKSRDYVYGKDTKHKISLMDIATIVAKELRKKGELSSLDISDENNACSIHVDVDINNKLHKYLLMFKNETHNHPTEIEPFGGAATCLGGAIRDPLSGRTYVYNAMRVTGSADPTVPLNKTLHHKLPQKIITTKAAHGYSSYGNQIGLATGHVDEIYHPGYVAKRMEIGAVIGAAPINNVIRKKPSVGDVIILLGGRTGKDGIGGATGSSKSHTKQSISIGGAEVQKGNPICERKIQRLFRNANVTRLIKKCNDFGAGGVCVAIGELCSGIDINLSLVPKKYLGLNGTDLAISESQERMAIVVANKDAKKFCAFANDENLEATIVANVTNTNRLRMYWEGQKIVDITREFLDTNGATQCTDVKVPAIKKMIVGNVDKDIHESWKQMVTNLNVCSKIGLIQHFDSTIGAGTILMPLGGKNQLTPSEGMAALVPSFQKDSSSTASLMTYGFNPYFGEWSPFHMGYYSVIETVTKIVAMGGDWHKIYLSCQEYFEKLHKNSTKWSKPFSALLGAYTAQKALGIAAIGGKDSMSGSFENIDVPPTLVTFAVTTTNAVNIISPEFKQINSTIVLITPKYLKDLTIDWNVFKKNLDVVYQGVVNKTIVSAYSLKHFGVSEGLTKMAMGNEVGVEFTNLSLKELFETNYGGLILEIPNGVDVKTVCKNSNYKIIGKTIKQPKIECKQLKLSLKIEELIKLSQSKLADVFVHEVKCKELNTNVMGYRRDKLIFSRKKVDKPLVVIPVFPGTNCEYDSQYAFERAGAQVEQVLIRNLNEKDLLGSIDVLTKAINRANIIMLPGGFSGADEPDGSAKFIVNIFNNIKIKKAVTNFLEKREGLILGICNGFQALIKLGLLPYGKIQSQTKESPTLTYNQVHHHMSSIVRTKIVSNKSPWLSALKPNDVRLVPISHGEGQFVINENDFKKLIDKGQIATQYVDFKGKPSMQMPYNPNGSAYGVEGILSLDGRIFGKMGHSERIGPNLYRNVIGEYDQKIFESGVNYFTHKSKTITK